MFDITSKFGKNNKRERKMRQKSFFDKERITWNIWALVVKAYHISSVVERIFHTISQFHMLHRYICSRRCLLPHSLLLKSPIQVKFLMEPFFI